MNIRIIYSIKLSSTFLFIPIIQIVSVFFATLVFSIALVQDPFNGFIFHSIQNYPNFHWLLIIFYSMLPFSFPLFLFSIIDLIDIFSKFILPILLINVILKWYLKTSANSFFLWRFFSPYKWPHNHTAEQSNQMFPWEFLVTH